MSERFDALVAVWRAWDASPRSEQTANALEDAVQAAFDHPNKVRAAVAKARRDGEPLLAAIRSTLGGQE